MLPQYQNKLSFHISSILRRKRRECRRYFKQYYAGEKEPFDYYKELVISSIKDGYLALDAGCGKGLRGVLNSWNGGPVIGVDLIKEDLVKHHKLNYRICGNIENLPLTKETFDVVVCNSVLEHLLNPSNFFSEVNRILKPYGDLFILTPNKYGYVALISKLIPKRWHPLIISFIHNTNTDDIFKTHYRANTINSLRCVLKKHGFLEKVIFSYEGDPDYLIFSKLIYKTALQIRKIINKYQIFQAFRSSLICHFQKT